MKRILIVEDEAAIANLIKVNLIAEGYQCICAYDGKEGADYIEKETFDLILLDIMLPEINGYELLEYVKPIGTPIVFLTARGGIDDRIKGLKLGADDYIVKPFQIGELLARIEALLRRYGKVNSKLQFADVEIDMASIRQGFCVGGGRIVLDHIEPFAVHHHLTAPLAGRQLHRTRARQLDSGFPLLF